jgi:hypothetical protein
MNWRDRKTEESRSPHGNAKLLTPDALKRLKAAHADGVPLVFLKERFGVSEDHLSKLLGLRAVKP